LELPIGSPRAIPLTNDPRIIIPLDGRGRSVLIQPQGCDAYYRLDGVVDPVTGFKLTDGTLLVVPTPKLVVWTDTKGRLIVQELA